MNILIDAIPLAGLLTGIARYLRNLYGAVARLQLAEVSFFTGKAVLADMPDLAPSERWQQVTQRLWQCPDAVVFGLRYAHWLKYEFFLNRACRRQPYDLYHETAFTPARLTAVPSVYSIYDLSLRRYRETHPRERVWFFEYFIKRRLRYTRHVLTISEFIRQEIIDEF